MFSQTGWDHALRWRQGFIQASFPDSIKPLRMSIGLQVSPCVGDLRSGKQMYTLPNGSSVGEGIDRFNQIGDAAPGPNPELGIETRDDAKQWLAGLNGNASDSTCDGAEWIADFELVIASV